MTFREGCLFNSLADEQQQTLFDWLELHPPAKVLELAAAPPPDGFGLKLHLTSLRRFHLRFREKQNQHLFAAAVASETETETLLDFASDPQNLRDKTTEALTQFALELATVHQRDPVRFSAVARWINRLQQNDQRQRKIQLLEQRLAFDRQKFEFNAARAALVHLSKLNEIVSDPGIDNEDKIWAARSQLFGPLPPDPAISNP